MNPCSCISRMPSSLVAPQTPACVVTGMPRSRATSNAAFSGKAGSPVTSKAICTPIMSSPASRSRSSSDADGGVGAPLPRAGLDVAVGHDEPAGHRAQRVDRGLAVVDGVQVVRPVDGRGHAGVERLDGREPVARRDVLGPELLAVLEVVPDEVLGERPVGAVAAHRGLPHVPVGVDHPGHHDAAAGVDLLRCPRAPRAAAPTAAMRSPTTSTSASVSTVAGVVHGQHRAAAEHHRAAGLRGCGSDWVIVSSWTSSSRDRTAVRIAVTGAVRRHLRRGRRRPVKGRPARCRARGG